MNATLVDRFLEQDMKHYAQLLGVTLDDFRPEPSVFEPQRPEACSLQIARFGEGYAVIVTPTWKEQVTALLQTAPWKDWLDSPGGFDELVAALGLDPLDRTPRFGPYPTHSIALLCDATRFRPYEKHAEQVFRITPEHPLWNDPDAAPKWPFRYVIVEDDKVIAQAIMKHNLDVLDGRTWALGVSVKPKHRRKGYGKAVVSAATEEIVKGGGLALWNTDADNIASLALCQALGYEKFSWRLNIPYRIERPTVVDLFLGHTTNNWDQRLNIDREDFTPDPSAVRPRPPADDALYIVHLREGYAVGAPPEWKERMTAMLKTNPWTEWLDSPQGLDQVLAALGLEEMDTTDRPGGPKHEIGLLCDAARFRPYEKHTERVIRLTPGHPLWAHPADTPVLPFSYGIVEDGALIAEAYVRHNVDLLGGRTWALGVYVKPEHRGKGYGKAVVSTVTKEVVESGALALYTTSADNPASLALCRALGYEEYLWYLRIPEPVEESADNG